MRFTKQVVPMAILALSLMINIAAQAAPKKDSLLQAGKANLVVEIDQDHLSFKVWNLGDVASEESTTRITQEMGPTTYTYEIRTFAIPPGGFVLGHSEDRSGQRALRLCVEADSRNAIDESDENDNSSCDSIAGS